MISIQISTVCKLSKDFGKASELTLRLFREAVHLRDGPMMNLVVPTIRKGGVDCVYVVGLASIHDQLLKKIMFRDAELRNIHADAQPNTSPHHRRNGRKLP